MEEQYKKENKKLLLENAGLLHSNTELRRERDRVTNLMYELMKLLHSHGFRGEDADSF